MTAITQARYKIYFLTAIITSVQHVALEASFTTSLKSGYAACNAFVKDSYVRHPWLTAAGMTATSCVGLYAFAYSFLRKSVPPMPQSIQDINCTTLTRNFNDITHIAHIKNIGNWLATKKNVTIFCTGFISAKEGDVAARGAHRLIQASLIPSFQESESGKEDDMIPCITFDFPDNPESFNFGQARDQQYLDLVYKEIIAKNLGINITLVGICRGALTVLNYVSNKTTKDVKNIKAIILDEPANPNIQELLHPISYWLAKPFFPAYNPKHANIFDAKRFPKSIPILIGSIEGDAITTKNKELIRKLIKLGCNRLFTYTHTAKQKGHGFLIQDNTFAWILNAFLSYYQLPHNPGVCDAVQNAQPLSDYRTTDILQT